MSGKREREREEGGVKSETQGVGEGEDGRRGELFKVAPLGPRVPLRWFWWWQGGGEGAATLGGEWRG